MDTVYLITGLVHPALVEFLLKSYTWCDHKILSTWDTTPPEILSKFTDQGFKLCLSTPDTLYHPQSVPIANGVAYAKTLGYSYVIRSRTDIFSDRFQLYMESSRPLYTQKLTILAAIYTYKLYFLDILVAGSIESMVEFYAYHPIDDPRYNECFLLESYLKPNYTIEDILCKFHMNLNICIEKGIEFYWFRPPTWRSPTRSNPFMRVVSEYCKESFIQAHYTQDAPLFKESA